MAGTTLAQGSSVTLTVVATDSLLIDSARSASAIVEAVTGVAGSANRQIIATHPGGQRVYGPFGVGTVKLSAVGGDISYMQGSAPLADEGGAALIATNTLGKIIGVSSSDGNIPPYVVNRAGAVSPYRLAVYGDSRANVGGDHITSSATATTISGEKVATQLCMLRGDMQIVFNGGISGDTAANWNSAGRTSSSQSPAHLIAANPDLVLVQYGINDLIAGTSAATILGYLQAFADKVMGAGIPFVFESINTAAAAAATYINGYSSTGGFGSGAATELANLATVRAGMQAFLALYPPHLAFYVDTSSVSDASDGYAKTDKTYYDGTHMSRLGCRAAAVLVDNAIKPYFPRRVGNALKLAYPNGCNYSMLTVSSGRAANFNAMVAANGSGSCTYEVGRDSDGNYFQQYNVTVTALASGYFQMRFDVLPDWAGASPFYTLAAGDVMQGSVDYYIDNGSGGAPIVSHFLVRPRFYYNSGASNENTSIANVAQAASTDYPALTSAESGRCIGPRLAVAIGKASSDMDTTGTPTAIQVAVYGVSTGSFRLRLFNPQWGKVA